jgi:hypothetical protein
VTGEAEFVVVVQTLHVLPHKAHRPRVLPEREIGTPHVEGRGDLQRLIAEARGRGQRTLSGLNRTAMLADPPEVVRHVLGDPGQAPSIVEAGGEGFSLREVVANSVELGERVERAAKVKPEVDARFQRLPSLGQVAQRDQRRFEAKESLAVG